MAPWGRWGLGRVVGTNPPMGRGGRLPAPRKYWAGSHLGLPSVVFPRPGAFLAQGTRAVTAGMGKGKE